MLISIILAHPKPGSFNHTIADTTVAAARAAGHDVRLHDLQAEGFDPVHTAGELAKGPPADPVICRYCEEIIASDGIVIVHPNWWAQPPAILKGWVDRVLRQGLAYEFGPKGPVGLLKARCAVIFNTSNTPLEDELKLYGDPLDNLWRKCIFEFCGVPRVARRLYTSVVMSTPEQRGVWLEDVRRTMGECFPGA